MSKVTVKLNRAGVRKLLKSSEMQDGLSQIAFSAKERLGEGYEAGCFTAKTRVVAQVSAVSIDAIKENAGTNSLLKALK